MPRIMEIATPLGPDVLLFKTLTTTESLGEPYRYKITAFSCQSNIDPNALIGNIEDKAAGRSVPEELRHRNAKLFAQILRAL